MIKENKNSIVRLLLLSIFLMSLSVIANQTALAESTSQEQALFGPITFMRSTGKPNEFNYTFNKLPGFKGPFKLVVINGEENGQNRISSAKIVLNGTPVIKESHLNQNIGKHEIEVQLSGVNTLHAVIKSKPGGFIKVSIVGQVEPGGERVLQEASGRVGPAGGSVSIDNFTKVTLPEQATRPELTMTVQKIESPEKLDLFHGQIFNAGPVWPELIRIVLSENVQPNAAIAVQIPPAFLESLGPDYQVELYAEFVYEGTEESIATFEKLGTSYDAINGIAYANIPIYAFSFTSSAEARIIIGSGPKSRPVRVIGSNFIPSTDVYASPRETIPLAATLEIIGPSRITSPLAADLIETDGFGPRTDHPTTGEKSFHKGVDLRANGDNVYPVLPGKVVRSQYECRTRDTEGRCISGYGYYVIIDHGNGLESRYAHLESEGLPSVGQEVQTFDVIGKADTSGGATGPHLHLEYRIDGTPVDPMDFINWTDPAANIEGLSVVALIDGNPIENTRRVVNSQYFNYNADLDLVPLNLRSGSVNALTISLENASGTRTNLITVLLIIEALPLRVTLTWDKYDTDVDLHVWDSLGNHSWFANLCGIPNGCLDRDDTDGFGPEVFSLTQMTQGATYTVAVHYWSDHGHGQTTARIIVEQGTQQFGPYTVTLSDGQWYPIGTFPQ